MLGLLLIVGLRAWINTWAPFFYTWDSTDYIANALGWLNSHSLSFFNTIRPPGYSLLLAGLISLTGGIEPAAGWANAGFGIGVGRPDVCDVAAVCAFAVAARWPVGGRA